MKRPIDLAALLLVLVSNSIALAQQPAEPAGASAEPADTPTSEPAAPPSEEGAPAEGEPAGSVAPEAAAATVAETPVEAPAAQARARADEDEMIVTGTRIRQASSFNAAAPVQVIDRKQLEYTGVTNLSDVIQYLTVAQGSGFQGQRSDSAGTSSINLRGLGAGSTLVLLNGRRLPTSGSGLLAQFSDISTIPLAAVERIEILKGGASAIYGSDAIGGVVNIITRRKFDGVRVEVDGGATTHNFDQRSGQVNGAFGVNSERGRVMLAMSYGRTTELLANKRSWAQGGTLLSSQGQPGSYIVNGGLLPDPNCAQGPNSAVVSTPGTSLCSFNLRDGTFIVGAGEQATALGTAEYDLTDHTTVFSELLVARLRSSGSFYAFPIAPPLPVIPANHVDNPYGTDVSFLGRPFGAGDGRVKNSADDDTIRILAGLKGDFEDAARDTLFESWTWELSASYGQSRYRNIINDNLRPALQDALNSCSDPAHLENCFNPFYSSVLGTGTPNSDVVRRRIMGQDENLTEHALQNYNAGMTGKLFELPGGEVGIAFGAELRHEWRSSDSDHDANLNNYAFIVGNSDNKARRDVYSGYLELRWPFYDGIEVQTAARAEHYTDIDRTALSPSAGLAITPGEIIGRDNVAPALRKLQFRTNVTSAFRAPNVYQSYPGYYVTPQVFYPPGNPLPQLIPVEVAGNPDLKPERALVFSAGFQWVPIDELSLMADFWDYDYRQRIEPENATQIYDRHLQDCTTNGGMCPNDPSVVASGNTAADISSIKTKWINVPGSLITNGVDFGAVINLTGATFGGTKDAFGLISLGAQGTYTLTYDIPRAEMDPNALMDGVVCDGTSPTSHCHAAGNRNGTNIAPAIPRWRMHFPVTWSFKGHAASVIPHFISAVFDDVAASANPDKVVRLPTIAAQTTLDLQYGYTIKDFIGKELTMRIGVYNVFDSAPPPALGAGVNVLPYEPELHDPRGRIVYAKLISQF